MRIEKTLHIDPAQQRQYLSLYFEMEIQAEGLDIYYDYEKENACVDLAVYGPQGELVGASGSTRKHVWISPLGSADGFKNMPIQVGRWEILLGAYHVPEHGLTVTCQVDIREKSRRLFCGDTHVHTTASDGKGSILDSAVLAKQQNLDFLFITDHNNTHNNDALPFLPGLTILPGCEWTHYKGHAGLLGVNKPFTLRYDTRSLEETQLLLKQAQTRGAFVVLNHPFCPLVPWEWGFDVPFDGIEVWNGVMSERNMRAIGWWHMLLCKGLRLPITGGSDYHGPGLLGSVGMPCQCVYALSREADDIIGAIRSGSGYLSYLPGGPGVDITAENGEPALGTAVMPEMALTFRFFNLNPGDVLQLLTASGAERIVCGENSKEASLSRRYEKADIFVRAQVERVYAPGLPPMIAMVSNAVYMG